MSCIAVAVSSSVLPAGADAGGLRSAPGAKPSGSDQDACQKANGMPGSAAPTAVLSVAVACAAAAPPETGAVAEIEVPRRSSARA